jgi:hypothetical protein
MRDAISETTRITSTLVLRHAAETGKTEGDQVRIQALRQIVNEAHDL